MSLLTKILIALGLVAAIGGYAVLQEHRIHDAETRASVAEGAEAILAGRLAQQKVSEKIVTKYVDRVQVVHQVGATIIQKVPIYVTQADDSRCTVPLGFARVHDAAAAGILPDAPRPSDAQPSGVALSAVAGTVVDNYTACHSNAEQLMALQDWVRANTAPDTHP